MPVRTPPEQVAKQPSHVGAYSYTPLCNVLEQNNVNNDGRQNFPFWQDIAGRETDNYRWTPLYALIIMLWGALFQKYWKRTCAEW